MEIGNHLTEKARYDFKLVILAREQGDQKAYAELMGRYRESVYFMLLKMVNNKDDADDLTIEAFGKAFQRLHQYAPTYAFSTWLFKIATNNCIDFIRRKKNASFISINRPYEADESSDRTMDIKAEIPDPEEKFIKKQKAVLMHHIVAQLKPKYKALVELRYFDELSYEEIAEKLDLPLGTVKAQLFRARDLLFNMLKKHDSGI